MVWTMPSRPLTTEQQADAARLKTLFENWREGRVAGGDKRSYDELAASIGMKQSAFSQRLNGTMALNASSAASFARLIGCSVADFSPTLADQISKQAATLAPSTGQASRVTAFHPDDPVGDEEVRIEESRLVRFAGGRGHEAPIYETVEDSEPATYRQSWFQKERINPLKTKRFRITGHSMEPMLFPNDTVLVNIEETTIRDGHIYAIAQGNAMRVKVLYKRPDGVLLRSINWQEYPDELVQGADLEEFRVIGKVRDKSGRGGLAGVLPDFAVPQPGRIGGGMDKNIMREIVELVEGAFPNASASTRANLIAELYELRRESPEVPTERLLRIVKIAS
jgi:phage repressor protein C with HTH and peptisase S24 domain